MKEVTIHNIWNRYDGIRRLEGRMVLLCIIPCAGSVLRFRRLRRTALAEKESNNQLDARKHDYALHVLCRFFRTMGPKALSLSDKMSDWTSDGRNYLKPLHCRPRCIANPKISCK